MNRSSDTAAGTDRPCGLTALLPLGMSCRGRAEAFARRLQSRLRTLGSNVSVNYERHLVLLNNQVHFYVVCPM